MKRYLLTAAAGAALAYFRDPHLGVVRRYEWAQRLHLTDKPATSPALPSDLPVGPSPRRG